MKQLLAALMCFFSLAVYAAEDMPASKAGPTHKVVYQCNKGGVSDYKFLLFSVSQLKEKYGDDIDIVVSCFGPGLQLLGKNPEREVPSSALEQMNYLDTYGVKFHACGNTMKALGWHQEDLRDFATVVPIGAEDLMLLQEQGYQYLAM